MIRVMTTDGRWEVAPPNPHTSIDEYTTARVDRARDLTRNTHTADGGRTVAAPPSTGETLRIRKR